MILLTHEHAFQSSTLLSPCGGSRWLCGDFNPLAATENMARPSVLCKLIVEHRKDYAPEIVVDEATRRTSKYGRQLSTNITLGSPAFWHLARGTGGSMQILNVPNDQNVLGLKEDFKGSVIIMYAELWSIGRLCHHSGNVYSFICEIRRHNERRSLHCPYSAYVIKLSSTCQPEKVGPKQRQKNTNPSEVVFPTDQRQLQESGEHPRNAQQYRDTHVLNDHSSSRTSMGLGSIVVRRLERWNHFWRDPCQETPISSSAPLGTGIIACRMMVLVLLGGRGASAGHAHPSL